MDLILPSHLLHHRLPCSDSLAKYTAAFINMSRAIRNKASSRFTRASSIFTSVNSRWVTHTKHHRKFSMVRSGQAMISFLISTAVSDFALFRLVTTDFLLCDIFTSLGLVLNHHLKATCTRCWLRHAISKHQRTNVGCCALSLRCRHRPLWDVWRNSA